MLQVHDVRAGPLPRRERFAVDDRVRSEARAIVERVRREGDAAVRALTLELDGADLEVARVPTEEVATAPRRIPEHLRAALERMAARLQALATAQLPREWWTEEAGIRFGEVVRPVGRVGCYVPGGRAAYPSTVLMTVVPARTAGVEQVVVCTPPAPDGSVAPEVLAACAIAGATEVHRVGGAQAVAAMAFGTEGVPGVDLIVGPGNAWVTAAKAEVVGAVGIDLLAGPTELVVVADGGADPEILAVDLIAQAEHDPLAETTLVTWEEDLVRMVDEALEAAAPSAARADIVRAALPGAAAYVVRDAAHAAEVVDTLAPEHLQVFADDAVGFLGSVHRYGAAFLGPDTPVSLGDYGVGSNHVLPTLGTARFASGLRASTFVTVSPVVEASRDGLAAVGADVTLLARAEGLEGHARAVEVRLR